MNKTQGIFTKENEALFLSVSSMIGFTAAASAFFCFFISTFTELIGSLSNDDGDGNENGEKAIGLDWQKNNYSRASRFFVHFFAVVARLRRENPYFHVLSRTGTQDNNFLFLFLNFDTVF